MAIQDAFIWGAGGKKLTPEEAERRRQVENALLAKGVDFSPVGHWTQGLARVADAAAGAFRRYDLSKGEKQIEDVNKGLIANLLAGGSGASSSPSASIPMSGAAGEVAATSPSAQPIDLSGNEVYNQFIGAAREGGLTNPYGLAALAATGKAESGFDPGNVNRTWSDPSQSGQPGTAGGILSWRGPRYQALAATGDLSPAGQARFFLQEDPGLIQALNNAKSVEEAQGLINNAWKFAGYDRADGETARRLALARSFLPTFQGGGEVAAATPEAAIEAIAPLQPVERGPLPASSYAGQERMPPQSLSEEVAAYQQTPEYAAAFPGRQQPAAAAQPVQVAGGGDRVPMASASTDINPAIIEALTNPQASEQTQRIAGILLEQEQARQKAAFDRSKPIEVNGRIINPMTGQVIADYSDPKTATVGNSVIDLRTGKPIYEGPQEPKTATVGNTVVDVRTGQPVYQGQPEATTGMREYDAYAADEKAAGRTPIGRLEYEQAIRKAGANSTTNIVGGEGDKFYENLDKKNAEMFSALSDEGVRARGKLAQINRLQGLLSAAPQGGLAALKQAAGEYGINTEGLSDIQSAQALINELVPQQRQPGSGPMSDADLALFKQSLPRIINQPGGNETIVNTMRGITEYQVRMGEIADAVADRSMTPTQGREAIRNLKNPLDDYTKLIRGIENDEQDQGWREISPGVRVRKID